MRRFVQFVFALETLLLTVHGQDSKCIKAGGHANLPFGDPVEGGIVGEREKAYKALPEECCDQNTAFLHITGKEMDTTCDNKRFKHKTVASKDECEEQCYDHYQKWAMSVREDEEPDDANTCLGFEFGKCPLFKCVTAVYYTTRPGCTGQKDGCGQPSCMLYMGYPIEIGVGLDGNSCNMNAADTAETLMLKPDCSLIPGVGYYKPVSTQAPRTVCNRASLPWASVTEHDDKTSLEPKNNVGSTRIRIYEKLKSDCCSIEGIFNHFPSIKYSDGPCTQTATAPFIRSEKFNQPISDDMEDLAIEKCKKFCYDIYLRWVMGYEDKPCLSFIFRRSHLPPRMKYGCDLLSLASYNSNRQCLHTGIVSGGKVIDIIQIKQQCVANETSYAAKVCDSSTVDACNVRVHAFGSGFLACKNLEYSVVVDTVYWTLGGEQNDAVHKTFCNIAEKKDYFNSRIRSEGFPTEIEFNMIPVGVHLCGYRWMASNINPQRGWHTAKETDTTIELSLRSNCRH